MKNRILLGLIVVFTTLSSIAYSKNNSGSVIYTLPKTSLRLEVKAIKESYVAGPYAKYAEKYLGISVPLKDDNTFSLESIELIPYLEADAEQQYVLDGPIPAEATSNLFKMTAQGLVLLADQAKGNSEYWRFPTISNNYDVDEQGATESFTNTRTTLYKTSRGVDGSFDKVAIQQSQVVRKSPELKAQEAANMIFSLRVKRLEIITGDTDATFSGEAMGDAIQEINRLESEYLELFLGKKQKSIQKMSFDVIPSKDLSRQIYVAFRVSDTEGLLPSNNVAGRPIVLELVEEDVLKSPLSDENRSEKSARRGGYYADVQYRVPSINMIKILDGKETLLVTRVPIYQLGIQQTMPLNIIVK